MVSKCPASPDRLKELRENPEIVRSFCEQFREARATALRDAEAFDEIIHTVERLGSFLSGKTGTLRSYREAFNELVKESTPPAKFSVLYGLVKEARNDAVHQGAYARHLTRHAIELALVLEDALKEQLMNRTVVNYMVRNPVCAELWQQISFIRQQMLANSFSFLPVKNENKWFLVSDIELANFLGRSRPNGERNQRLAKSLKESKIELKEAKWCNQHFSLEDAINILNEASERFLLVSGDGDAKDNVVGILTAFDLL